MHVTTYCQLVLPARTWAPTSATRAGAMTWFYGRGPRRSERLPNLLASEKLQARQWGTRCAKAHVTARACQAQAMPFVYILWLNHHHPTL